MSIIKHVTLQKIVAHDFRYDSRILRQQIPYIEVEQKIVPSRLKRAKSLAAGFPRKHAACTENSSDTTCCVGRV